jgi:hypothetical protein
MLHGIIQGQGGEVAQRKKGNNIKDGCRSRCRACLEPSMWKNVTSINAIGWNVDNNAIRGPSKKSVVTKQNLQKFNPPPSTGLYIFQ